MFHNVSSSAEELLLTNTQEVIQDQVNYTQSSPWPEDVLANHSIELLDLESDNFRSAVKVTFPLFFKRDEFLGFLIASKKIYSLK